MDKLCFFSNSQTAEVSHLCLSALAPPNVAMARICRTVKMSMTVLTRSAFPARYRLHLFDAGESVPSAGSKPRASICSTGASPTPRNSLLPGQRQICAPRSFISWSSVFRHMDTMHEQSFVIQDAQMIKIFYRPGKSGFRKRKARPSCFSFPENHEKILYLFG